MEPQLARWSFPKNKIQVLLLENINQRASTIFENETFKVDRRGALTESELISVIGDYHALGIRSRTQVTDHVLKHAKKLLVIGCFCIGTNQVDLEAAQRRGIPVFNSPFNNSRSVAELVMAEIIALSRHLGDRNSEMHRGEWRKTDRHCVEVRGKTLGIVGYGHIGTQLSVLAESMGMRVIFHDIVPRMALGNSVAVGNLDQLLAQADYVSLHVPLTPQTHLMIDAPQLASMKRGGVLINASRGSVVNLEALAAALKGGALGGAAIDVFPTEPSENGVDVFTHPLQHCPNVILTPHIGGSTQEAQLAIADEVATNMTRFINTGSTLGAVNFPMVSPRIRAGAHRILNVHQNVPGVLMEINRILAEFNIITQTLDTMDGIGYLVVDVDQQCSKEVQRKITSLPISIRTRILF